MAGENLRQLEELIQEEKKQGRERLINEYKNLVKGLVKDKIIKSEDELL